MLEHGVQDFEGEGQDILWGGDDEPRWLGQALDYLYGGGDMPTSSVSDAIDLGATGFVRFTDGVDAGDFADESSLGVAADRGSDYGLCRHNIVATAQACYASSGVVAPHCAAHAALTTTGAFVSEWASASFALPLDDLTALPSEEPGSYAAPNSEAAGPPGESPLRLNDADDVDQVPPTKSRKRLFASLADQVGFSITDPDTLSAHVKKKMYLQCLEQYVVWLDATVRSLGHEPETMQRRAAYDGLSNASRRTMIIHWRDRLRNLNAEKRAAEREFAVIREQLLMRASGGTSPFVSAHLE